ncbi:MAG TPA: amino acid permease [Gemmataceae bacterium]|nr:amino acid permease [Gemmataceae bacterium]
MKPSTPPSSSGLVRALGPLMATAVVVGTVIGSGIFKKPQSIAAHVPHFGLVALLWVVGGLLVLLGALAYSEVSVLLPRAGGNYVFLREAYGRLAGFLWGWVDFCIIRSASLAALATIFTESVHDIVRNEAFQQAVGLPSGSHLDFWSQRLLTVSILVLLAWVNIRGVRWGGLVQLLITLIKVGSLAAIAVLPFVILASWLSAPTMPDFGNLRPVWPEDWRQVSLRDLGSAFLGVLWAYHGWQNLAPVAEEVRQPQRNLPLALLGGVAIIITLYLGVNLAYYLVIPRVEMAELKQTTVATVFSLRLLGSLGAAAASAAVMASVFGALNGNLLVGPRLLYAMGDDGLAPRGLGVVHARYRTPALAIGVLAGWSSLQIVILAFLTWVGWLEESKSHFDRLTEFAMFGAVIFETLAVVSIFVFRRRRPNVERPYRCPGYPLVPALYVLLPAFVLVNMFRQETVEALAGVGFIALGAVVYGVLGLGRIPNSRRGNNLG